LLKLRVEGTYKVKELKEAVDIFSTALDLDSISVEIYILDDLVSNGCVYQVDLNSYILFLKERPIGHMLVTLAHEFVHIKQYVKDDLNSRLDFSIPYQQRWWEQEAFQKESILCKKLLDFLLSTETSCINS
jgi:hypothetical protein